MKKKKMLQLEKREKMMPLHHIDDSVILEAVLAPTGDIGIHCTRYINLIGQKYRAKICLPAMGEILKCLLEEDNVNRIPLFDHVCRLIEEKEIGICSVSQEAKETDIMHIMKKDRRIEPFDRLVYSCACTDKEARALVTIDKNLLNFEIKNIPQHLRKRIGHPQDF